MLYLAFWDRCSDGNCDVSIDETLRTANEVVVSLFLRCIQKPASRWPITILDASCTARVTFAYYRGPTTGTLHPYRLRGIHPTCREFPPSKTRWWFQTVFIFIPKIGEDSHFGRIFFRWVETTNQKTISGTLSKKMVGDRTYHARAIDDDAYSDFCRIVPVMCWKNDLHQLAMYKNRATKKGKLPSGWWFQIYIFKIPLPGEMIQFDKYFSNGLKPPTRTSTGAGFPASTEWGPDDGCLV